MKGTPYAAGRRAEYLCLKTLRATGWRGVRTAGSHGPFDIVAWRDETVVLIQVKRVKLLKHANTALHSARLIWQQSHVIAAWPVQLETWIRVKGYWYIYPYPFVNLDRRVK